MPRFVLSNKQTKISKSPKIPFKPASNHENDGIKESHLNSVLLNTITHSCPSLTSSGKIASHTTLGEDVAFEKSFEYISDYIFTMSSKALKDSQTPEELEIIKRFFIYSKNLNLLMPIKYACTQYINESYFLSEREKRTLKNFLDLCQAFENTKENVFILILIYTQIIELTKPSLSQTLSRNLKVFSANLLKKLEKPDNIKLKNPQIHTHISKDVARMNNKKDFYFSVFCSIIEDVFNGSVGAKSIYEKIKTDTYLISASREKNK